MSYKPVPKKPPRPLTDEQRDLAGRNVKLAWWLAERAARKYPWRRDEIESAAMMGLVKAAKSFDPSGPHEFTAVASVRIRMSIKEDYQESKPKGFKRRYRVQEGDLDPNIIPFDPEFDRGVEDPPDYADLLEDVIKPLPESYQHVCRRHYLYGEQFKTIAYAEGVCQSEISRRHSMAIKSLAKLRFP